MSSLRAALIVRSCQALGVSQRELGERLGFSRRTAQRWVQGGSTPSTVTLADLAGHVLPHDRGLAAELAQAAGTTLDALGLVQRPAPAPAAAAPPVAPPPAPKLPDSVVDAIVCAAVDVTDMLPRQMRPALLAAYARTNELGLTAVDVERALRATLARPKG